MKNKNIALTDAQRSMVEANMDVVRWAIRTSIQVNEQRYGFGYDDLFQEGCIWLCKAAVTYDPDGGASFPTYAQRVVENGLRTYCRLQHSKERRSFPVSEIFDTEADGHRAMTSGIRSLQEQLAEVDALSLLESAKQQYNGVARLGIEAIQLKFIGLSNTDIAAYERTAAQGRWLRYAGDRAEGEYHRAHGAEYSQVCLLDHSQAVFRFR